MKSITLTYPDFQALPKGIKRLLIASENLFFGDARSATLVRSQKPGAYPTTPAPRETDRPAK